VELSDLVKLILGAAIAFSSGIIAWIIKSAVSALMKNTEALIELKTEVKNISLVVDEVPQMHIQIERIKGRVARVEALIDVEDDQSS
jgi:divalent metal cation (Fe/Co/Zn/Cd) transporter